MRKNFNSVQTHGTKEDCYKFSTSVSYETLVGGTATTGRECVQNQWLSKGSANKSLTAVGTLTSLLCNSAKVMEKWLQTLRDLRSDNESEKNGKVEGCAGYRFFKTMRFLYKNLVDGLLQMLPVCRLIKIFCLVAVLSVAIIGESRAEIIASGDDCAADDGVSECHWEIVSTTDADGKQTQTLNISGKGDMKGYKYMDSNDKPWGNYTVSSIKVEGVDSIGASAFSNFCNVNDVEIGNSVTTIKQYAFAWTRLSSITMSDNLKNLNMSALRGTNLTEIILPYTTNIAIDSLGEQLLNVTCLGDKQKCTNLKNQLNDYQYFVNGFDDLHDLDLSQDAIFSIAGKEKCNTENYYWNGKGCEKTREDGSKPCADDYVSYKNECLSEYPFAKKRWTPAEANEWLCDGNDNFVVLTFKK